MPLLTRKEIARRLALYYSERFNGQVLSEYDESKRAYEIHGPCSNSTWTMLDFVTPFDARQLVAKKTDAELLEMARVKAAEVKAEADRGRFKRPNLKGNNSP